MKTPLNPDPEMLAPCGVNCTFCYKHVESRPQAKACPGCLKAGEGKPDHCQNCKIKNCARENSRTHCHECNHYPCILIKRLNKSYTERYQIKLIENARIMHEKGILKWMEQDAKRWICPKCQGAISMHDKTCSECGEVILSV